MHSNEVSAERNFTDGQEYFKNCFRLTGVEARKLFLLKWRNCLSQQEHPDSAKLGYESEQLNMTKSPVLLPALNILPVFLFEA